MSVGGAHGRVALLLTQQAHLAEHLAGPELSELLAVVLDARRALVDDREVLREVALADDDAARFDALLDDRAADGAQRILVQSLRRAGALQDASCSRQVLLGDPAEPMRARAAGATTQAAVRLGARRQPLRLALGRDLDHVPGELQALHALDQQRRRVELPAAQAVAVRAREGVVVVVPGLAERRQRQPPTLVDWSSTSKRRGPKKWQTELIAPGDVALSEHADQPAPEERREPAVRSCRSARRRAPNGQRRRDQDEGRERVVDDAHPLVLEQLARRSARASRGRGPANSPADVRVPEAADRAETPLP